MVNYHQKILLETLILAICFRCFLFVKCVFLFRVQRKLSLFMRKNCETPKLVADFLLEKDTFRKKIMEIVQDNIEKFTTTTANPGNRRRFCV